MANGIMNEGVDVMQRGTAFAGGQDAGGASRQPLGRRQALLGLAGLGAAGLGSARAQAAWPAQTVRIVAPYSAGGTVDLVARLVADDLSRSLPQRVLVENRTGGGTTIAAIAVAGAPPDGHTLLYSTLAQATMRALHPQLPVDVNAALVPVSYIGAVPIALAVNADIPARTVQEFIALARANPGKFDYASSGIGTPPHLAGELFCAMAGVRMNHVPYRGSGNSFADVIAGNVAAIFVTGFSVARQPNVRVLAIASRERAAAMPDVPTLQEAGLAGLEAYSWHMVFAPSATPAAVQDRIGKAVNETIFKPEIRARLAEQEIQPVGGGPAEARAFFTAERDRWERTLREIGLAVR
jgi:tripartite-type tricarboxylate transporter receptor subunit TctC